MTRRQFALSAATAAAGFDFDFASFAAPFPVRFIHPSPYDSLTRYIPPGNDAFLGEKDAIETEARLNRIFAGAEPAPPALRDWVVRRADIRWTCFHALPESRVRFEIAVKTRTGLEHHTGLWKLPDFAPVDENAVASARPWFRDVTSHVFANTDSFRLQLLRGNPSWRARLDSAAGMDVDGNQGIAVGDIDNDGADEIYVCQAGGLPNRLYKIDANGRAIDITQRAGLGILDETTAALFADFRNSGAQDLVVLRRNGPLYFINDGAGIFRESKDAFRFARPAQGAFTGMAAADYDRDGRLDLYLCTYVYVQGEDVYQYPAPYHDARNGPPNHLFRNRATEEGLVFEDVTRESGIDENNNRFTFSAAWCDFDGDGGPDLYVANDFGRNNLYRNRNGRFTDEASRAGVEDVGPGMSASWFDYDGDGKPDLYISNMWTAAGQRVVRDPAFEPAAGNEDAYRRHTKGNSLYRNKGDGAFEETGAREQVEMGRWAWSSGGFDFDLDGSPEIVSMSGMVTNRSPGDGPAADLESFFWRQVVAKSPRDAGIRAEYENGWNAIGQFFRGDHDWNGGERNVFYARRDGRYADASGVSGLDFADDGRAFAVTDFDGDGYPDLILKNRLGPQVRAMQNTCARGPAIAIRLRGKDSNRDAIGARVTLNGQMREITAGSGFLSQHSKTLHFGMGGRELASVRIAWPSGLAQEIDNLKDGLVWTITEGDGKPSGTPFRPRTELGSAAIAGVNPPEFGDTWLIDPIPDPGGHGGPSIVLLHDGSTTSPPSLARAIAVDLSRESPELAAAYALFHRYLFEYRGEFTLPVAFLLDERGSVRKVYASVPGAAEAATDFAALNGGANGALPFPGRYYTPPARNYFKLGIAYYWAGYPRRALPYLEETARTTPSNSRAFLAIGEIQRELGNPDASLDAFRRALAIRPDDASAAVGAGMALLAKQDVEGARGMFAGALKSDPQCAEAANQLGLIEVRAGKPDDARKWFERAIEAQRDHAGALNNLGVLFAQQHRYDESIAVFRYGLGHLPDDEPLHLNLARVYAMSGERDTAVEVVRQLLEIKPDSAAGRKLLSDLTR